MITIYFVLFLMPTVFANIFCDFINYLHIIEIKLKVSIPKIETELVLLCLAQKLIIIIAKESSAVLMTSLWFSYFFLFPFLFFWHADWFLFFNFEYFKDCLRWFNWKTFMLKMMLRKTNSSFQWMLPYVLGLSNSIIIMVDTVVVVSVFTNSILGE